MTRATGASNEARIPAGAVGPFLTRRVPPRLAVWGLVCAFGIAAAAPVHADGSQGACAVIDSPFGLDEIIGQALVDAPGTAVKAGFVVLKAPDLDPVTLYHVKIALADGGVARRFYDVATGEAVLPPTPAFTLLEAYDLAVAAVEAAASEEGSTVVLKGALVHPLLAPTYVFAIVDPQQQLAVAHVDALTGEVGLFSRDDVASGEPKRRLKKRAHRRGWRRHLFQCDEMAPDPVEVIEESEVVL